jgi:hypothetical protein
VKPLLSIVLVGLALCPAARADVKIHEVGLSGYVAHGQNRVTIEIGNPASTPQDFTLRLLWRFSNSDDGPATDYKLRLNAGESRKLDLPMFYADGDTLVAQQIDPNGAIVASAAKEATSRFLGLIAVVCSSTQVCTATAQAIRAGDTIAEQNEREQQFKIVLLENAPENWFAYQTARSVVVSGPISAAAAQAIADYARLGGKVIVAMDQAPRDFLADYRVPGQAVALGRGSVKFLEHVTATGMQDVVNPSLPKDPVSVQLFVARDTFDSDWLLDRVGTSFDFPPFWSLLVWMAAYTVLVGLLNFLVLRRIGKVEWAWITVPVLALIFGVAFYLFGARGKSSRFALDEVSFCWMDEKSTRGALGHSVRVASPRLQDVALQAPASALLASVGTDSLFRVSDISDVWRDRRPRQAYKTPDVTIDSAQHFQMPMLRFSFRDLEFESVRDFPGTVRLDHGRLKNSTGQNFSQAVLVDFQYHQFYDLGALPNGSEVDPFSKGAQAMERKNGRYSSKPLGVFSLPETMRVWNFDAPVPGSSLVFLGLTDQSMLQTELEGVSPEHKTYTVFHVEVSRPQ